MKLASLKEGGRDGALIVLSRDLKYAVLNLHEELAPTLQFALDNWAEVAPHLEAVYRQLNAGKRRDALELNLDALAAPLPRAYQWAGGSAYVNHVELVHKARGAEMPESYWTDPLMYQGGAGGFLGPRDDILAAEEDWGIDFGGEVAVITGDVPMGIRAASAARHIKLLMLANDVSLRNLIPDELAKGFGFCQSKPASSFSPVAVTPDELGEALHFGDRVRIEMFDAAGNSIFGAIDQQVVEYQPPENS